MITCTTCGSFIAGRSFKKHKSSIKHITYEKLLVSTNNTGDIANINDVSYVDDNILVDNHSAVNEATATDSDHLAHDNPNFPPSPSSATSNQGDNQAINTTLTAHSLLQHDTIILQVSLVNKCLLFIATLCVLYHIRPLLAHYSPTTCPLLCPLLAYYSPTTHLLLTHYSPTNRTTRPLLTHYLPTTCIYIYLLVV